MLPLAIHFLLASRTSSLCGPFTRCTFWYTSTHTFLGSRHLRSRCFRRGGGCLITVGEYCSVWVVLRLKNRVHGFEIIAKGEGFSEGHEVRSVLSKKSREKFLTEMCFGAVAKGFVLHLQRKNHEKVRKISENLQAMNERDPKVRYCSVDFSFYWL